MGIQASASSAASLRLHSMPLTQPQPQGGTADERWATPEIRRSGSYGKVAASAEMRELLIQFLRRIFPVEDPEYLYAAVLQATCSPANELDDAKVFAALRLVLQERPLAGLRGLLS